MLSINSYSILQPFGRDFSDPLSKHYGTPQFATAKTTKNQGQRKFMGINHIDNVQEAFPHRKKRIGCVSSIYRMPSGGPRIFVRGGLTMVN